MKKIIKIFILITFLIAVLLLFVIFKKEDKLEYKDTLKINIGDELPKLNKYLDSKNLKKLDDKKISWKDITIEENKIYYAGKYTGTFNYKKEKYSIYLIVEDSEKPVIENVKDINIYVNNNIDLLKNIKVIDNSHEKIDLKVEGEYDIKKAGTYNLKYVASDSSGNRCEKEFKLIVKEKPVVKNNSSSITGTTNKGYKIEQKNGIYYVGGILIANKTYKLPSTYNPGGLLNNFTSNFNKMKSDASKEGINLKIISGFRSYNTQRTLYNNYVARDGKAAADTYSARAGHSEHQTGLAADINSLEQTFIGTKEGKWLNDNCYKYGFIIRYPKGKENITGYMYEPWHIRYVGVSVATSLYNNGNWITLEEYLGITSKY